MPGGNGLIRCRLLFFAQIYKEVGVERVFSLTLVPIPYNKLFAWNPYGLTQVLGSSAAKN